MIGFSSLDDAKRVVDVVRVVESMRPAARGQKGRQFAPYIPQFIIGMTDAAHNKAASGTISVYDGNSSTTLADTGNNITAYNRFGNVASGKYVVCLCFWFGWEIIAAEC